MCGVVAEKCDFPFVFNGYEQKSCIEFNRLQPDPAPNDEGDSLYCKTAQGAGKGKFASWSWGLCNDACLSDDGSESSCTNGMNSSLPVERNE